MNPNIDPLNCVAKLLGSNFGNFLLASVRAIPVSSTGDVIIPPALVAGIGIQADSYRVRRIVARQGLVSGVTGDVSSVNLAIWDGAGGTGNNLVANGALTGLTGTTKYFELTLTATANNTVITSNTLYVNVGTSLANATIELDIYGDVTVGRE